LALPDHKSLKPGGANKITAKFAPNLRHILARRNYEEILGDLTIPVEVQGEDSNLHDL
jgi:hypothetical protein